MEVFGLTVVPPASQIANKEVGNRLEPSLAVSLNTVPHGPDRHDHIFLGA